MKAPRRHQLAPVLCIAGAGLLASGQTHADPTVKVSGFGSLAATRTTQDTYEFRASMNQAQGTGTGWDLGLDSRLGLQGVAKFNDEFSVTAQLLGQRRRTGDMFEEHPNSDFDVGFEWLFAQYSPVTNFDLKLGRVVLPAFMISDSRNVGFSQPWLRAPVELYGHMPLSTADGAQLSWRIPVGAAVFTLQPTIGTSRANVVYTGSVVAATAKDVKSMNAILEYGDWLVRYGQVTSTTPFAVPDIPDMGVGPLPGFDIQMKDKFTSLGLQYDNGQLLVMAEVAKRSQNNFTDIYPGDAAYQFTYDIYMGPIGQNYIGRPLASSKSWYVAGGYHFGQWLPMLAYAHFEDTRDHYKTHSINASVRYDLATGVALKAQVGRVYVRDPLMFLNAAAHEDNHQTTTMAVGVDFVF